MSGTVNYTYDPNQQVFVIVHCIDPNDSSNTTVPAVRVGKVVRVRFEALVTTTKLVYDVQVEQQSGTTEIIEADVFADLGTAVAEYQLRLT